MKALCVFCGSSPGDLPVFTAAAQDIGRQLAERDITLVYGGRKVGLMGAVADAALSHGGKVIGVIPKALVAKEVAHGRLTELRVVDSMHERKALMAELAQGFIALPGGFGTFEEFCEVLTWTQLGLQRKPCGLLNVAGFYTPLLQLFDHAVQHRFLRSEHRALVHVEEVASALIDRLMTADVPVVDKWVDRRST